MLVGVFGTSTPYAYWGFSAVRRVMQVLHGDQHHIHCTDIDQLRQSWAAREGKSVVFTSDCPDIEISDLFLQSGAPLIVFLDEPEDAIAFAMISRPLGAREAIRFSSRAFCSLYDILMEPSTFCFPSECLDADVKDIFAKLFQILAGSVVPEQLEEVMRQAVCDYHEGQFITVADLLASECAHITLPAEGFAQQEPEVQDLIRVSSEAYRPMFKRKPLLRLEWPRDIVFTCNEGHTKPELIELTGPARFLIWGPYFHLPKGDWIVKVEFEVAENFSGAQLETDIYDGQNVLVVSQLSLPVEGIFSFEFPFTVRSPYYPIEVRFALLKGAIEGKFGLRSLSVRLAEAGFEYQPLQSRLLQHILTK
jgi:hypothetical protein